MIKEQENFVDIMLRPSKFRNINLIWNIDKQILIIEDTIKDIKKDYDIRNRRMDSFISCIYESDRARIFKALNEDIELKYREDKKISTKYRIVSDSGELINLLFEGIVIKSNDIYYVVAKSSLDKSFLIKRREKILNSRFFTDDTDRDKNTENKKIKLIDRLDFKLEVEYFLEHISSNHKNAAMLYVNFEEIKHVNEYGDFIIENLIISEFENILNNKDYKNLLLCKYNYDSFLIFIYDAKNKDEITNMTKGILEAFRNFSIKNKNKVSFNMNVGIAICSEDNCKYNFLVERAYSAMKKSKLNSIEEYQFFNSDITGDLQRQCIIHNELITAIDEHEMFVLFQPKVSLNTLRVGGFEALIRWNNKKIGFISPSEFIPIAEKSKMIVKIGDFVLEEVFRKIRYLLNAGKDNFKMAVNLSEVQLRNDSIVERIRSLIKEYKVPPKYLEMEITETVLMKSFENNVRIIQQIKNMGITIALDDFGTGYSSLNYLTKLPIDVLKIDKTFFDDLIQNPKNKCIVQNIINLSHQLGIEVVAEGIEDYFQVEYLKEIYCDLVQGFYFSKPRKFDDIVDIVNRTI